MIKCDGFEIIETSEEFEEAIKKVGVGDRIYVTPDIEITPDRYGAVEASVWMVKDNLNAYR